VHVLFPKVPSHRLHEKFVNCYIAVLTASIIINVVIIKSDSATMQASKNGSAVQKGNDSRKLSAVKASRVKKSMF